MKNKRGMCLSFVFIMILITILSSGKSHTVEFPPEFWGTWERAYQSAYSNTLTITSNTIKDSTQSFYWELQAVSGNNYTLKSTSYGTVGTIYIKYENDNLIFGVDNTRGEHDWQGAWKK